jgi:ribosomal protein L11 methyltransferase
LLQSCQQSRPRRVIASDNDPIALRVAQENATKNGASARLRLVRAEGLRHPLLRRALPDLLLANLLLRPLVALAPDFVRALRPGGIAMFSDLTLDQCREVEERYRAQIFSLDSRILLD